MQNIQETRQQISQTQEQRSFQENFRVNYYKTEYVKMFEAHEDGQALTGEYLVKFDDQIDNQVINNEIQQIQEKEQKINITQPQDARDYFLTKKWDNLKQERNKGF